MIEWNVFSPKVSANDALGNVVVEVGYSVYARLDDQIVQGDFGQVRLSDPDPNSFIAMSDLSKDVVMGWAKDALGADKVAEMESKVNDLVTARLQTISNESPTNESQVKEAHFSW